MVSHDRYFLNRVCTHILAFEPEGTLTANVGDYDTYYAKRQERLAAVRPAPPAVPLEKNPPSKPKNKPKKGLTFKEERELEALTSRITELETEIGQAEAQLSDPEFYRTRAAEAGKVQDRIGELKNEYEQALVRWEELETKRE